MREAQAQEDRAACASACPHDILSPSSKIRKGARCHEQPAWPVDGGRFVGGALHRLPGGAVWRHARGGLPLLMGGRSCSADRVGWTVPEPSGPAGAALLHGAGRADGRRAGAGAEAGAVRVHRRDGAAAVRGRGRGRGACGGLRTGRGVAGAVRAAAGPEGTATEHAPGRMGLRCTDLRMLAAGDAGLLAGNISL